MFTFLLCFAADCSTDLPGPLARILPVSQSDPLLLNSILVGQKQCPVIFHQGYGFTALVDFSIAVD